MFSVNNHREGPQEVTIPASTYNSCRGCKFYDYGMIKSGMHPLYRSVCTHTQAPPCSGIMFGIGNLFDDNTPEWCPYLKVNSNESEGNRT